MEKGSFHTSHPQPVHANTVDDKIKSIPLPSQVPKGLDFNDIPVSALKSSTLESLISQNEDLMARLSVSLRKVNELEEYTAQLEEDRKHIRARFDILKDQILVLQEKDKSATMRGLHQHEENTTLKVHSEKLERHYNDLYKQAGAFQKRLVRLERYRARIQKASAAVQNKARLAGRFEQELIVLKKELSIQHAQMVNSYELKLADARAEVTRLQPKADERDRMYEDLLKAENAKVYSERQFEEYKKEAEANSEKVQAENAGLRMEVKELLVDREAKIQEINDLNQEMPHLRERHQAMTEQVESLQALWNHKQFELERQEEKNQSLQKLNQSLSSTLNQQRKEIHELQAELEKEKFTAAEKIKTLLAEIQMLRKTE